MLKMFDTVDREELLKFLGTLDDTLDTLKEMKKEGLTEDQDGLPRGFYSDEFPFVPEDEPLDPVGLKVDFSDFHKVLDKIIEDRKLDMNEVGTEPEPETDEVAVDTTPLFNVSTTPDEKLVYIQVQLSGWSDTEVEVHLNEDLDGTKYLEIIGETETVQNDEIYIKQDFSRESFNTKITISEEAFSGDVEVSLENGLLTVVFTVAQPVNKSKKVF